MASKNQERTAYAACRRHLMPILNNSSTALFLTSFVLSCVSFYLFVNYFPFPTNDPENLSRTLPWVLVLTPSSNNYKYWYPLALIYIPMMSFSGWLVLNKLFSKKTEERTFVLASQTLLIKLSVTELTLVSVALFFLLTNFSYASFYSYFINFHHFNYVTGPLNDLLNGRILLVDSRTQYGFLNIFLTSFIFKETLHFSHGNVHFLSMIFIFLEYLIFYLILRILTKRKVVAVLGVILIFSYHYYGMYPILFPSELPVWPGYTWRYFMSSMVLLLVLNWHIRRSTLSMMFSQAGVALALFWQFESGICILISYLALLFVDFYMSGQALDFKINNRGPLLLSRLLTLTLWILGVIASYSCYTYLLAGMFPDWTHLIYYTKTFNKGFYQGTTIPSTLWWYWPILIYGAVLFLLFGVKYLKYKFPPEHLPYLVFLSVFGFGIFRYYIGWGGKDEMKPSAVVIPACLILVYFANETYVKVNARSLTWKHPLRFLTNAFIALVFFHAFYDFCYWTFKLNQQRLLNYQQLRLNDYNVPKKNRLILIETNPPTIPFLELTRTLDQIKKYVPEHKPIALIAAKDHPMLMQSERINLAHYWYMNVDLYTQTELDAVVELYIAHAKYLFVEKELLAKGSVYLNNHEGKSPESNLIEIFRRVKDHFIFEEDIGLLYVYRKK
ncbi:MAG: hypothetical protein H7069_12450 [Phormidesmis sp. FL-bin-119]|nr:hypothetical protein [Pedobacter sp.]